MSAATIKTFYAAFNALDWQTMTACYHPDIQFEDPAFGKLHGAHVGNMWRMLCESQQGKDFKVELIESDSDGQTGSAIWTAEYTFSRTGKRVHNRINSRFQFAESQFILHIDDFDVARWAHMALGLPGLLLGWTPMFRKRFIEQSNTMLARFESSLG